MKKYLFVLIMLTACGQRKNAEPLELLEKKIYSVFPVVPPDRQNATQDGKVSAYFIIPNTGCPGCISSAEQILMTFLANKYPVRFVLTNITSFKTLKLKLGDSIVQNRNVYLDKDNEIYNSLSSFKQAYPMIIYVDKKDHHFTRFEYVEPENPESVKHIYTYLANR